MNKLILLSSLLCFAVLTHGQQLNDIRLLYKEATKSRQQAAAFYAAVDHVAKDGKPVWVAYKGAGLMLMARYEKMRDRGPKVREAAQWIEHAVDRQADNAEIRLVRLSVQEHLPKFLKYNQAIQSDRQFIQDALPSLEDGPLKKMINGYFKEYAKPQ